MDRKEVFQILGIEDTKDERMIKNAYREKLAVTNPEDDAEGFMRLRTAYEEACRLAKQPDNLEADGQAEPEDTSPSGLWLNKVKEVYASLKLRSDVNCWKELFDDEVFMSLEEEENCSRKLLGFLMNHFRLPSDVWKLMDRRLGIVKDAAGLREHFPADFVRFIISKCERGEDLEFSQFEGADDAPYDLFLQYYDRCWQAIQEEKIDQANEHLQNADQLNIRHPALEICRARILMKQDKTKEAIDLLEELRARYPGDSMVNYNTAESLWKIDERDRAAAIYQGLKEETDTHYMANFRLTEWYYGKGQYREAKKCAEKVLYAGGDPDFMELLGKVNVEIEKELEAEYRGSGSWEPALELCWCYLQDGKVAKGIRLAANLEKLLPPEKEAEYNGLLAKLFVEEAEYEDSIAMTRAWEVSLEKKLAAGEDEEEQEKDRDRLRQAHLIRLQCYHSLGYGKRENFSLAIGEGNSTLTGTAKDVGVLLEMAQIYVEMEEYERSLELVDKLVNEYQILAAHAISLEGYRRQLNAGGVISTGQLCLQYFKGFVSAYEYMAKVYLDLKYKDEFWKLMEEAENNGVKSDVLDAYRYQMNRRPPEREIFNARLKNFRRNCLAQVEKGQMTFYESGLKELTQYLYQYPDSYMFVERGIFHKAAHHYEEAREDYEKALALSPANPYALNGLSLVYKFTGDYEKALMHIKRAILYMPEELTPELYTDMADIYSLMGDYERALLACRRYESTVKEPEIWYLDQLGECYVDLGQTEEACRVYERYQDRDLYKSLQKQVDACVKGYKRERAWALLTKWKDALDAACGRGLARGKNRKAMSGEYCTYYLYAGWTALVAGEKKGALAAFKESLKYMKDSDSTAAGRLGDAVFACVVCGDRKLGERLSKQLKNMLAKQSWDAEKHYYGRDKVKLRLRLLAGYYTESDGALQKMLDEEGSCGICSYCTSPYCKELECIRVMFLLKTGREQEARERLRKYLEIQPSDEYLLAIRHTVFSDERKV